MPLSRGVALWREQVRVYRRETGGRNEDREGNELQRRQQRNNAGAAPLSPRFKDRRQDPRDAALRDDSGWRNATRVHSPSSRARVRCINSLSRRKFSWERESLMDRQATQLRYQAIAASLELASVSRLTCS